MMQKFHVNLLFFALSFYCFGAGVMDSFIIYDGWRYVGNTEFPNLHQAMGKRIVLIFVLPMVLLTILNVLQYWFRPPAIPRSWITMALLSQLIGWLSSVFIQIPIQIKLDSEKDDVLLEKLIYSDWLRVFAWFIYIIIVIAMLYRINKSYLPVARKKLTV